MKLKHYEQLTFLITLYLGYEFLCLNNIIPKQSTIQWIGVHMLHQKKFNYSPVAGYPISYFLGWLGFVTMLLTNLYIIRKRLHIWESYGKTVGWFDFHIFCGVIGPIFIVFHSNFKVGGLVSISFWSMIIASSSGIVGKYFYIQTLRKKEDIEKYTRSIKSRFVKKYESLFSPEEIEGAFSEVLVMAGANAVNSNPALIFFQSLRGDLNLFFGHPAKNLSIAREDTIELKKYGVEKRRILFIEPFNKLLGYWHAFHLPFAIFMYIVAIIHIAAALLFSVKH